MKEEKVFVKNGQIKVTQDPSKGLVKVAEETDKEFGIDDLIQQTKEEEINGDC